MRMNISSLLFLATMLAFSCKHAESNSRPEPTISRSSLYPDLSLAPLPPLSSMGRQYFDRAYPNLSADQLDLKWKAAKQSPMMMLRSYVNVWYDEAALVEKTGPIGPCFGDAHVENFGFLWAKDWIYTFNDLDDVGRCPVIFDALRFFTTVSFFIHDAAKEEAIRSAYIGFLNGEALDDKISDRFKPDKKLFVDKLLKDSVKDNKLIRGLSDVKIDSDLKKDIYQAADVALGEVGALNFVDAIETIRDQGGSAGLVRYTVLGKKGKAGSELLEMKELTSPGSERGPWSSEEKLSREEFTSLLWDKNSPQYLGFPRLGDKSFLLRSMTKTSPNLEDLSSAEQLRFFIEDAYILAQIHKKSLQGTQDLSAWLKTYSGFMVERYTQVVKNANL